MFQEYTGDDDMRYNNSNNFVGINKLKGSRYQRGSGALTGYTGHFTKNFVEGHVLEQPMTKMMIRGYTGHRPYLKNLCGAPLIPSEEKQLQQLENLSKTNEMKGTEDVGPTEGVNFNFRSFAKHMDTIERYAQSVRALIEKGQSQEMLLRIVQAKMSERVNSYALQMIRTRKLFEAFDINGDGVLDEGEFRICLEKLNIQFDDVQNLALFAYFDDNNDGFVEWQDFADHAMVQNPKGGTAVLPKMITAVSKGVDGLGAATKIPGENLKKSPHK